MNNFTKKFKELLYAIKTDDHYSEYDPSEDDIANKFKLKEFNLTKKYNNSDSLGHISNSNGSSVTNFNQSGSAISTGNDELNLSDDENNYHHNPTSLYANNDLEYSSDNIHLSHLGDHRYRNSSNDIDEEDEDIDQHDSYNDIQPHSKGAVPYEDAIDDGSKEVIAAWDYIKNWCAEHSNDLYASLNDPCSSKDLKDVEKDLELFLPKPVKVSLRIHDGQELDGLSGVRGLLFGLSLMTLDEIVSMKDHWSKIYYNLYTLQRNLNKLPKQGSIPPNHIKLQYCNPKWVPMITDNAGNHIAIDLDPGMKGIAGQVIIFGRDFDTKFVLAENWGQFLTGFVQDLKSNNWDLEEDEDNDFLKGDGELLFIDTVNNSRVYEDYLNVLKRRVWSNWKRQRDLEILAKNKPRFNAEKPVKSTVKAPQQPLNPAKNSARVNKEVERRVGSIRDFTKTNTDNLNDTLSKTPVSLVDNEKTLSLNDTTEAKSLQEEKEADLIEKVKEPVPVKEDIKDLETVEKEAEEEEKEEEEKELVDEVKEEEAKEPVEEVKKDEEKEPVEETKKVEEKEPAVESKETETKEPVEESKETETKEPVEETEEVVETETTEPVEKVAESEPLDEQVEPETKDAENIPSVVEDIKKSDELEEIPL